MSAHTPGPWYSTASDPAGICVYAEHGGAHNRVAVIDALKVNGAGAANARLIAAAPALLAVLQRIVDGNDSPELWRDAHAALRAAKGETAS